MVGVIVIRYSREEILALKKPSKILPEMEPLAELVYPGQQDPECYKKLDNDDVYRLWHAPDHKNRSTVDSSRGRG